MAVLLMTEPSGVRFPTGKQTVEVSPRARARSGPIMTSSGSMPSSSRNRLRSTWRRSLSCHQSRHASRVSPLTVRTLVSNKSAARNSSITSGTPPARNTCTVANPRGPFGRASTRRGVSRLAAAHSSSVGRFNPAENAIAGRWISRFVEPPNAACSTIALRRAPAVSTSFVPIRSRSNRRKARAERFAVSSQIGCPEGASAECGNDNPRASPTTCEVAAVPRNWHPPPGLAHARHPTSAAYSNVICC